MDWIHLFEDSSTQPPLFTRQNLKRSTLAPIWPFFYYRSMKPSLPYWTALFVFFTSLQTYSGQFKDGPFAALPTGGDVENENLAGGWQAAYEFNDLFTVETVLAGQTDEIISGIAGEPLEAELELNIVSLSMTGRLGWFFDPVGIFIGAGVGYYFFDADAEASRIRIAESADSLPPGTVGQRLSSDFEDSVGYHAVVGLEWILTGSWEVFLEYRHVTLETDVRYAVTETVKAPGELTGTFSQSRKTTEELSYDHGLVRAGINYRF